MPFRKSVLALQAVHVARCDEDASQRAYVPWGWLPVDTSDQRGADGPQTEVTDTESGSAIAFLPLAAIAAIAIGVLLVAVVDDVRQTKRVSTASVGPTAASLYLAEQDQQR